MCFTLPCAATNRPRPVGSTSCPLTEIARKGPAPTDEAGPMSWDGLRGGGLGPDSEGYSEAGTAAEHQFCGTVEFILRFQVAWFPCRPTSGLGECPVSAATRVRPSRVLADPDSTAAATIPA